MIITSQDLKELKILKYYRVIRKSISMQFNIQPADLEVLIYLDGLDKFNQRDFKLGMYVFYWDKYRWKRLLEDGWIDLYRKKGKRNRTNIYKTSNDTKLMIMRMYRIMLGEEDIPQTQRSPFYSKKSYTQRAYSTVVNIMNKDKER